ncbi:D-sedoheptulose-7-phosphate isomerase [Paenibacillus eucommiae]|uniref:D-sedoheptulose 7-phosphate isomerase n=1 Tax=Paenibacillus eucommiae TaxID=1355755 RepID=A0ABS4J2D5_9BACL|nr:SIS domain-containing protein [Paenibacillus eucommiae]MBP1993997.1 D-sedoheptulose 7-phosphate isomerase [Paenibacillus eucommiae]
MNAILFELKSKYPELSQCIPDIEQACEVLTTSYRQGGKLLVCGNGGSASDSEHIVGELMKGFMSKRPLPENERSQLRDHFGDHGSYLADHLQGALPAISLVSHSALISAFANDVAADMVYAQQVYGYGVQGDVVLGLSTSGNSRNVLHALQVARLRGLRTIGMTGQGGGAMKAVCDVTICVPWERTPDIQERHLPIYHALCILLEEEFFPK